MKRLVWLTDIHLNFLSPDGVERFLRGIRAEEPETLLVGGDIGEADNLSEHLDRMSKVLECPIYFVFGNHDYAQYGPYSDEEREDSVVRLKEVHRKMGFNLLEDE